MDIEGRIIEGVAMLIQQAGLGVWSPAGTYTAGQTGIYDSVYPEDVNMIALTTYPVRDPVSSESIIGLQVRCRLPGQDPRPSRDLDGAVFDLLDNLHHAQLPNALTVTLVQRQSGAWLDPEANKSRSRVSNYHVTLPRPSPHRL